MNSKLYIMKFQRNGDTFIKVGKSKDINSRLQSLTINHQGEVLYKFDDKGIDWSNIENIIHKTFIDKVYIPEVQLPSGNTEIYHVDLLPSILAGIETFSVQSDNIILPVQLDCMSELNPEFYTNNRIIPYESIVPKFYTQLRQATHIKYIKDNEEHLYKLHESTKIIYTFLLQRFSANNRKLMYLSYDRVAAECALSRRTVIDKINELVDISVVKTSSSRSMLTGRNTTTLYTNVENLVTSNRFKLYSQSLKDYYAQLQSKQEKLTSLADYVRCNLRDEYKKDWTRQQASNFWRNTNNELITGEYFKGLDKSARLHYKLDFHKEELEDFEITLLQDNLNNEDVEVT